MWLAFLKNLSGLIANIDWWMILLGVLDGREVGRSTRGLHHVLSCVKFGSLVGTQK